MEKVKQDVLCALLESLWEKRLISQEIFERSREMILNTEIWPDWLGLEEKEETGGSA